MGDEYQAQDAHGLEAFAEASQAEQLMEATLLHWREKQEQKTIAVDVSLAAALRDLPASWIDGILLRLGLQQHGVKRDKVVRIAEHLLSLDGLWAVVGELPALSRAALQAALDHGGWLVAEHLIRDYGDDARDGWFWNEELPESPLGLLRVSGLLFIGRAHSDGRWQRIAVVPSDLREPLLAILSDATPPRHNRLLTAEILQQVLQELADYAAQSGAWRPPLQLSWLDSHLRQLAPQLCADELWATWNDLNYFLFYLEHFHHEITCLEDLRDFHLSELVNEFADIRLAGTIGLQERRRVLETVVALYAYLADAAAIDAAAAERVAQAAAAIAADERELQHLHRPAPLGGELALQLETGAEPLMLTFNDLWLLALAAADFGGSLRQLREATAGVASSEQKRRRIDWLMQQDLRGLDLAQLPLVLSEEGRRWFYRLPYSEQRVW